jgi:hypothetical protein
MTTKKVIQERERGPPPKKNLEEGKMEILISERNVRRRRRLTETMKKNNYLYSIIKIV